MKESKQSKARIYCAIYTRKSTSEGLNQDFTSLDAQREAAESYINSQKHEGWVALQEKYDDGGFTGANLERPCLQKLLSDIKEHKITCVVVYKVDRLSRSLMDFAHLLEFFDKNNVTFVSVTQAFNTNTSMGRLTLNILLSFAQFEREIISERTRDKMGAARKKGKWLGGRPLLGYDIDKEAKKLVINKDEAKIIREIFDLYLQGNSLLKVAQALNNKGYRTKRTTSENGRTFGGFKYGVTQIQSIITSVLYIGKVCYAGQIYDGEQSAIIDEETFKKAQEKLKQNRVERKATKNIDCTGLLTHLLHCKTCKSYMFHTYTLKNETHKYRYYVCTSVQKHGYNSCPTKSVNAQAIEDVTIDCLRKIFADNKKDKDNPSKQEIEAFMSPIWDTLYPQEKRRILKALIKEIDYDSGGKKLGITLNGGDSFDAAALVRLRSPQVGGLAQDSARRAPLRLEFNVDLKKVRPLNKWHKEIEIEKEPQVRKMLILAYQIQQFVNEGRIKHPREACKWLNLSVTRMDQFMNTLFLCPAIQNEIFSSSAPAINALTEFKIRPLLREAHWDKQLTQWQALIEDKK